VSIIVRWLRPRKKKLLVHGLILSGFLLYCIFLANPLFSKFGTLEGNRRYAIFHCLMKLTT